MPAEGFSPMSDNQPAREDEFVADKKVMWSRFIKLRTWGIVTVAILLLGLLIFLTP